MISGRGNGRTQIPLKSLLPLRRGTPLRWELVGKERIQRDSGEGAWLGKFYYKRWQLDLRKGGESLSDRRREIEQEAL